MYWNVLRDIVIWFAMDDLLLSTLVIEGMNSVHVDGSQGADHGAHIACHFFIIAESGENMVSHGFLELRLGCDPCIARFLRLDSMAYRSEDRIAEYNTCEKACCLGILVCCEISSELV